MHFLVHVILPADLREPIAQPAVEAAVERLLTPFAGGDGGSPDGWFDWYELGGRFAGAVQPVRPLSAPPPSGTMARLFPPKPAQHVAYGRDLVAAWSEETAPFVVVTPDGTAHGATTGQRSLSRRGLNVSRHSSSSTTGIS